MVWGDRELVSDIYEAAVTPERWFQVFEKISSFAGANGGFMIAETAGGARSWVATERFRPVLGDFYAQGWHLRNTWAERGSRRRRLQFFDETEIFAPGEIDTIPMYRDFIRPRGGGWSAGALMQIPNGGRVSMRFERPFHHGPMDPELRARLNVLRPHLSRAAFLFTRLGLRQARSTVSALQFMDIPAAVLTRSGRLLACNVAMEDRLSQVSVRAGDRIAFKDRSAQEGLSSSLARLTAGLFDQLRGPIPLPATEENGAAVAYLIPMRGAAQDIFGCETTLLMIRPAHSENRLMDLVRTTFVIDAGESQRLARLIASVCPRLAAALLTSTENVQVTLDRLLGQTRSATEAKMASFLWKLGEGADIHRPARAAMAAS
ncbi:hypothetical protein [Microvirga arsenatis]|uniref:Uncharacterized protein n=1 Tax=Microvirga arsenatis TaxID=2692265 RepID=A0ABW9YXW4_9HYPH|nr:hypothetical protein [Microvirga arsenatis]NBJ10762.1 hypothetical protein [Microvirga arsenatis]NBJ24340.1 hypothetical protein [Microvirga arsenatis]